MAGVQVGLKNLYYAVLTKDDATGVSYLAPVKIAGAINAKISPKSNTEVLYADDGPDETATALGEIDVEFEAKDISLADQAALLGHSIVGGVMLKKATDVAPYVALGFMSKKSNGQYRYIWLTKGMFALPDQEYATGEDKPKFQTPKLKGTFVKRAYDDLWQRIADEDHPDYVASIGANWFNSVEGTADTTPPTVTVVPANNATNVAVGASVNWTFSEAILASLVTDSNFFLIKDSDGSAVAGTLSINTARTVVTFTPGANLSAATAYRAICTKDVCDLAGNKLAANSVTKFTTA
jgi:phi13 family phage major tail protein